MVTIALCASLALTVLLWVRERCAVATVANGPSSESDADDEVADAGRAGASMDVAEGVPPAEACAVSAPEAAAATATEPTTEGTGT